MSNLAAKLKTLATGQTSTPSGTPSAIFGTANRLSQSLDSRSRIRIGLWPCLSDDDPQLAMGLMTTLAFLLERWTDVLAYRVFVQLDDTNADTWTIERSQFEVDDWQIDQLDENAALWGKLNKADTGWTLSLFLENDLIEEDEDVKTFEYSASNIAALCSQLPQASTDIATALDAGDTTIDSYEAIETDNERALRDLLTTLFVWQVNLLRSLQGWTWPLDELTRDLDTMRTHAQQVGGEFGPWALTNAIAHAMQPGYGDIADNVAAAAPPVVNHFPDSSFAPIYISQALYRKGQTKQAFELMEAEVERHPQNVTSWRVLAELYRLAGRGLDAADTFQRAIEADAVNVPLYLRYGSLLNALSRDGYAMQEFILIELETHDEDLMVWEAVEAYEEALKLDATRTDALQQQIYLLIDLEDTDRLWPQFGKLVELDDEGVITRSVMDALYNVDDIDPAFAILKSKLTAHPDQPEPYINLAIAYMIDDEIDDALETLEDAAEHTDDPSVLADIDRLMLSAEDPEFEMRLGEIVSMVDAGNRISNDNLEFLEDTVDTAPMLAEAYVALAKAYVIIGQSGDALETLLDGHDNVPEDPDIIEMLARLLWDSGEEQLAFDYLNKGVEANPNHVPLLTRTGEFLFRDGQHETARAYLARAEAISPRHPALQRAKAFIAQQISQDNV